MTSTMGQDLANIYGRELDRLADEITAYENDTDLWTTMGAQKNPPGSLALHTVGALMHFISGALGGRDTSGTGIVSSASATSRVPGRASNS